MSQTQTENLWPQLDGFKLHETKGQDFAFYYKTAGWGFAHALEVRSVWIEGKPERKIAEVKHLSGNSWGQTADGEPRTTEKPYTMTWLVCRTEYYPSTKRAVDALTGKTEVPKGKRKPRPISPMTDEELKTWAEAESE